VKMQLFFDPDLLTDAQISTWMRGACSDGVPQDGATPKLFTKGSRTKWPFRLVSATSRSSTTNYQDSVSVNSVQARGRYFVKYNIGPQQRRHTLGAVVRGNLRDMRLSASKIPGRPEAETQGPLLRRDRATTREGLEAFA
jgi:hypothetical protein